LLHAERRKERYGLLGLWLSHRQALDNPNRVLACPLGQRDAQRLAPHLLRHQLPVFSRVRSKDHTTTAPVRRPGRPLTSATGALLTPRLLATARHLTTGLR